MQQSNFHVPRYFTKLLDEISAKNYTPRALNSIEDIHNAYDNKESVLLVKSAIRPWRRILSSLSIFPIFFGWLMYFIMGGDFDIMIAVWMTVPLPAIWVLSSILIVIRNVIGPAGLLIQPDGFYIRGFFNKRVQGYSWNSVQIKLWEMQSRNSKEIYATIILKSTGFRRKYRVTRFNHFNPELDFKYAPVFCIWLYYQFSQAAEIVSDVVDGMMDELKTTVEKVKKLSDEEVQDLVDEMDEPSDLWNQVKEVRVIERKSDNKGNIFQNERVIKKEDAQELLYGSDRRDKKKKEEKK